MILRLVLGALATAPGLGAVAVQPAAGLEEPFTRGNPSGKTHGTTPKLAAGEA